MSDDSNKNNPQYSPSQEVRELEETVIRIVSEYEPKADNDAGNVNKSVLPIDDSGNSPIGKTIADNIVIKALVGSGGMSCVYRGVHTTLKREVAVKIMHGHLLSEDNAVMRFIQEAQAVGRLDHTNIIKVHDFRADDAGNCFLIMDLVKGTSLHDTIEQSGPLMTSRAIDIFMQACEGLEHAHSKGIVHRDLKPSNIMLTVTTDGKEQAKILDFGIAKILPQQGDKRYKLTQTGEVFGSPLYMSPEQCMGKTVDHRSDIYSMGCLIFEALTGQPPLQGANAFDTFFKHTTEMPASIKQTRPDCDNANGFDAIILKAMAKDPNHRYQSMAALKKDLEQLAGPTTNKGWIDKVSEDVELVRRKLAAQRNQLLQLKVILFAMVFLMVAGAGGFYYFHSIHPPEEPWEHLFVQGQQLFDTGNYKKANDVFESAIKSAVLDKGKQLAVLRELVDMQIADNSGELNKYSQQLARFEQQRDESVCSELDQLVQQFKKQSPTTPADQLQEIAQEINDKTNLLQNPGAGAKERITTALQTVLKTFEQSNSTEHNLAYARALDNLAASYYANTDYSQAIPLYEKATRLLRSEAAVDPSIMTNYLRALTSLAFSYSNSGQLASAEQTFKKVVSEARKAPALGTSNVFVNNSKMAFSKFVMAEFLLYVKKDYSSARTNVQEAIRVFESLSTPEPESQAKSYALLGIIELHDGNRNEAQKNFESAKNIFETLPNKTSTLWPETLVGLADINFAMGNYAAAQPLYRRAFAVGLRFVPRFSPTLDRCFAKLLEINQPTKSKDESLSELLQLGTLRLQLDTTQYGEDSLIAIGDLLQLSDLMRKHREIEKAADYLEKAKAACKRSGRSNSWEGVQILLKEALLKFDSGKRIEGEAVFRELTTISASLKSTAAQHKTLIQECIVQLKLRLADKPELQTQLRQLLSEL